VANLLKVPHTKNMLTKCYCYLYLLLDDSKPNKNWYLSSAYLDDYKLVFRFDNGCIMVPLVSITRTGIVRGLTTPTLGKFIAGFIEFFALLEGLIDVIHVKRLTLAAQDNVFLRFWGLLNKVLRLKTFNSNSLVGDVFKLLRMGEQNIDRLSSMLNLEKDEVVSLLGKICVPC